MSVSVFEKKKLQGLCCSLQGERVKWRAGYLTRRHGVHFPAYVMSHKPCKTKLKLFFFVHDQSLFRIVNQNGVYGSPRRIRNGPCFERSPLNLLFYCVRRRFGYVVVTWDDVI